ncbi:MAG: LysR family transcriptional regulator [Candidatus Bathyarchaeota archaeon]|nr:LysR family transcriptional regulator [Candidatus Bathyarchaeota archaeon]
MRLEYLRTYLTVDRTGSFSVAAKELGTSQGTVSNHIAALEEFFEAELFKRTAKGVEVTAAGAILKNRAHKLLDDFEATKAEISVTKQKLSGVIKILASTIPGEHILPSLLAEFQKLYPQVKFRIKAEDSLSSLAKLHDTTDYDFALVGTINGYRDQFDILEVGAEELVLIVPNNHELTRQESVTLNQILPYPYINRGENSGTRKEIEKMFIAAGIPLSQLRTTLELGSTQSVITAVSQGRGISVISSTASKQAQDAGLIKILPITGVNSKRKLYMIRSKRPLLKTSEVFWTFCKQAVLEKPLEAAANA